MSQISLQHLQRFEQETLPGLNTQQRRAVDLIEGPVMVIAGPGTGKTQLLAARIGNILRLTDSDPRSVLCLTYTEAGTVAMRKRLVDFLGPEGHRVPVHTFHSFCNAVIQENPGIFGSYREMQPLGDLEQRTLMKALIDGLPGEHPLRRLRGDFYYDIPRLSSLFDTMKREDIDPERMGVAIDTYIADLPQREGFFYAINYKGFKKGDPKMAQIAEETEKMVTTRAAANLLPVWQELLDRMGRYDFSDMLRWVRDAFAKHEMLLRTYQERFLYILVDEYQDTSNLQNEVLFQLADFWEEPNLFVVGDDDQAIYRFQGASMANILEFQRRYRPEAVFLTDNYRSTQAILDASDALIDHNSDRLNTVLQMSKKLRAASSRLPSPGPRPELHQFDVSTAEDTWVLHRIKELIAQGLLPKEIAVLYRNHRQAENLLRICRHAQIPVYQVRRENILHDPFIISLLEVLRYIVGEANEPFGQEARLLPVLHFRFFGIAPLDLARLLRFKMEDDQKKRTEGTGFLRWREILIDDALLRRAGLSDPESVKRTAELLEHWIGGIWEWTPQTMLEKVLTQGGALAAVVRDMRKQRLLELANTLMDHIKAESAQDPLLTLEEILARIEEMNAAGITLPYENHLGSPDGVTFSTVHSAKGLEWSQVFLIAASAKNWGGKSNNKGFKLPDGLAGSSGIMAQGASRDEQEERRLFFVGMTRAKLGLSISYAEDQKASNSKKSGARDIACLFYNEVLDGLGEKPMPMHETVPVEDREATLEALLHPLDVNPSVLDAGWLRERIASMALSVTALNKYLACPRAFYYENVLRVPSARNQYLGYGNAVHGALQTLFNENPGLDGDVPAQLVGLFERYMQRHRSHFTDREYENRLEHGRRSLPEFVASSLERWRTCPSVETEVKIGQVEWEGFPITGKLDKVEKFPDGVRVVDYKTGNFDNARKKLAPAGENWQEVPGGDYWRQIVFYDLLLRADRSRNWSMRSAAMEFVDPDGKERYQVAEIEVTEQDRQVVTAQISFAMQGMRDLQFDRGCHDPHCIWCNLLDRHVLPESLSPGPEDSDLEENSL